MNGGLREEVEHVCLSRGRDGDEMKAKNGWLHALSVCACGCV